THYKLKRSINQKVLMMHRSHGDRFLFKYPGADGVKTGYTHPAGRCYVGAATHKDGVGDWRLVSVVLHAKDTLRDTTAMMDYGFKAWGREEVVKNGEVVGTMAPLSRGPTVSVQSASPVVAILRADQPHTVQFHYSVSALMPVAAGQRVGSLEVRIDDQKPQRVWLIPVRGASRLPGWKRLQETRLLMGGLAILVVGCGYGSFAKANRRRRVLLPARSRGVDSPGPGHPQWQNGHHRPERGPRL
ncbi:MAG: hypothetical protein LC772_07175, partial [Chloroflexi bacterium]|nr:hypothetical protein [Chloroflexota bacterium]